MDEADRPTWRFTGEDVGDLMWVECGMRLPSGDWLDWHVILAVDWERRRADVDMQLRLPASASVAMERGGLSTSPAIQASLGFVE